MVIQKHTLLTLVLIQNGSQYIQIMIHNTLAKLPMQVLLRSGDAAMVQLYLLIIPHLVTILKYHT